MKYTVDISDEIYCPKPFLSSWFKQKSGCKSNLSAWKGGMKICQMDRKSQMYIQNNLQPYSDMQLFLFIWFSLFSLLMLLPDRKRPAGIQTCQELSLNTN